MQDRNTWSEDRRIKMGNTGHTDDGRWRIKRSKLSYLQMDFYGKVGG